MQKFAGMFIMLSVMTIQPLSLRAQGMPDTFGNRVAAAQVYLEVFPIKSMIDDSIIESSRNISEGDRAKFIQFMQKSLNIRSLEQVMVANFARHFTVQEIQALVNFYGSEIGVSIMKKMGPYMADVMPSVQREVFLAQQRWLERYGR